MDRHPIAILSFNRPHYLARVLDSLRGQLAPGERPLFLFQDGAINRYSRQRYADDGDIDACVALFRASFPHGVAMVAEHNLGCCENYLRAETFMFEELGAEAAYFFEDDLVLSPHYLTMLDALAREAAGRNDIGYVAAYGTLNRTIAQQMAHAHAMQRMSNMWAYWLTRRHWRELHAWLEPYYGFVVGTDYRRRPTKDILAFFRAREIPLLVSGQDGAKRAATYALGRACVNTMACFGRYIGEQGLHMTPARFAQRGYARAEFWPEPVPVAVPDAAQVKALREQEYAAQWRQIAGSAAANAPRRAQ